MDNHLKATTSLLNVVKDQFNISTVIILVKES